MMATVIQFPSPPPSSLRLREVVGNNGRGVVTSWLSLHSEARARFRIRVRNLRRIGRVDWPKTQFRHLGNGLAEIKWKAGKKEFRAIGFDHDDHFVMVLGCTHKQNVYDPPDCLNTAARRRREVEHGKWRTIDFEP
jgi:phage-related protein